MTIVLSNNITDICLSYFIIGNDYQIYCVTTSALLPLVLLQPWRSRRIWKGARLDGVWSGLGKQSSMETQAIVQFGKQLTR